MNTPPAAITLRPPQREAAEAAWLALRAGAHPVLQLPTGVGKSLVAAELAARVSAAGQRVWVVTHVRELVSQNAAAFTRYTGQPAGVVCAGLGRRELGALVTFCSVQSVLAPARAGELELPVLIIVDEVHRVRHNRASAGGSVSLYEQLFRLAPEARRVGLSATPWRTDNGLVYGRGEGFWFDTLAYQYTVPAAVRAGYLAPLVGVETAHQLDTAALAVADDYVQQDVARAQSADWLTGVARAVGELAARRRHLAVYCPTLNAAERTAAALARETGWSCAVLSGSMSAAARDATLGAFRTGEVRVLLSVDTITTGFDFPALDCLIVLRPTVSSNLWVQIQGRGTRLHPGKRNCLVLDFVGNYQRLGGVDMVDTYVRQGDPLTPLEATPAAPREPRERIPGVRTLTPVDPMTGAEALNGARVSVAVHRVSCVAVPTRRYPYPVLMVTYACTTPEGARLDASAFINTAAPRAEDLAFFARRGVAVQLPAEARALQWLVRKAPAPARLTVSKQGRYWNMIDEQFNAEGA